MRTYCCFDTTTDGRCTWTIILALAVLWITPALAAEDRREPTVGAEGLIEQIKLPGTELTGKPIDAIAPIVVRVTNVFPHGDAFRYDLQFHGMEPGNYDLRNYLVRKDGSSTDDLPEIPVRIKSLLPPGQIEPNPLDRGWLPRLGGYKVVATLAVIFWFVVLLALIFAGRKKPEQEAEKAKILTLADLLMPRLQDAVDNKLEPAKYAELERMLFAFWRKRLRLELETPEAALKEIHNHDEAGPLMRQLEQWMHNPARDQSVDLRQLLQPYQNMPADVPEFQS